MRSTRLTIGQAEKQNMASDVGVSQFGFGRLDVLAPVRIRERLPGIKMNINICFLREKINIACGPHNTLPCCVLCGLTPIFKKEFKKWV